MEVVQSTFKGKKFQMVPISLDLDSDLVSSFYREHNLTMPAYLDPGQNVASRYNITEVPETFLIDTEGIVVRRYIGQHPWASTQMLAQLEKLIP